MNQFENHQNYNCQIVTDNNEEFLVFANWLHNEHLDHWKGWNCQAGQTRLLIDKNLQVWSGECKNDFLGSALENFYTDTATICKRETCTPCTDDLLTRKNQQ